MTNDEKLHFLQTVNFLIQFLTVAKSNEEDKQTKSKIKKLINILEALQARILDDPWIQSILKVDNIKIDVKFYMAAARKDKKPPLFVLLLLLLKFFRKKIRESASFLLHDYKFS